MRNRVRDCRHPSHHLTVYGFDVWQSSAVAELRKSILADNLADLAIRPVLYCGILTHDEVEGGDDGQSLEKAGQIDFGALRCEGLAHRFACGWKIGTK